MRKSEAIKLGRDVQAKIGKKWAIRVHDAWASATERPSWHVDWRSGDFTLHCLCRTIDRPLFWCACPGEICGTLVGAERSDPRDAIADLCYSHAKKLIRDLNTWQRTAYSLAGVHI